jgi:FtsH-binding integral membrane protein
VIYVFLALAAGLVLSAVGAWAVARIELKSGLAPTIGPRLVLAGLQAYLSTWTIVQVAASVVLSVAPLEEKAAALWTGVERTSLAAIVLWMPFAIANLVIAGLVFRRGDRDALAPPMFAAATYAVALVAVAASGWFERHLGG